MLIESRSGPRLASAGGERVRARSAAGLRQRGRSEDGADVQRLFEVNMRRTAESSSATPTESAAAYEYIHARRTFFFSSFCYGCSIRRGRTSGGFRFIAPQPQLDADASAVQRFHTHAQFPSSSSLAAEIWSKGSDFHK